MLSAIVDRLPVLSRRGPRDVEVHKATADSRQAGPGSLFAAIPGLELDGHRFIGDAVDRGATAVLLSRWPDQWPDKVVGLEVPDPRRSLALAASVLEGEPAAALQVHAITGTNGKTTTAAILRSILEAGGGRAGTLGTTGILWTGPGGEVAREATHTTPEGPEFYRWLRQMVDDEVEAVAVELSSHALHQGRVAGLAIDVAAWSNLGRDHLDYHHDLANYEAAKALLLSEWLATWGKSDATFVLNVDDPIVRRHVTDWSRVLRVSSRPGAVVRGDADLAPLEPPAMSLDGIAVPVQWESEEGLLTTSLLGEHNLANCLLAGGCALGAGLSLAVVETGWRQTCGAPGRLQRVQREDGAGPIVVVDYAHTPGALREAMGALRTLGPRRLITVFGCGGDRDMGKRPAMAAVAAEGSDLVILTSDNPRSEDPESILDQVEAGLEGTTTSYLRHCDRRAAIAAAVGEASDGDVVLLAGKGHETWQEIAGQRYPFDDQVEAACALERWS
ncbi:MAG TPA: UDP-N-acetylmuramoyl-L-alanyl-D-glutamate--2,6-diaminopimelate ligase [Deltaproteobacteria bacterium]|nr:UDP-N-acetylmuramoyl-L-alanyl-D-glutamate--2,6-diaminopimelate ligase [Deltaproteobacteria bacterium]HCP45132.1 UDP-N-acetylmuramoyl-L-alanyl-D-glutamate--2,6-diaminopimelate ligase [Deltaproteobacteria bacterium]